MITISIVFISVFFGGLFLFLITKTIVFGINQISKRTLDNQLKLKLIERGLSVNDIERLMDCELDDSSIYDSDSFKNEPRPPVKHY